MYELCNRTVPFPGDSLKEVTQNVLSGKCQPICQSYSKELRSVVAALLCSNPDLRPSATDILGSRLCKTAIRGFLARQQPQGVQEQPKQPKCEDEVKKEQVTGLGGVGWLGL